MRPQRTRRCSLCPEIRQRTVLAMLTPQPPNWTWRVIYLCSGFSSQTEHVRPDVPVRVYTCVDTDAKVNLMMALQMKPADHQSHLDPTSSVQESGQKFTAVHHIVVGSSQTGALPSLEPHHKTPPAPERPKPAQLYCVNHFSREISSIRTTVKH